MTPTPQTRLDEIEAGMNDPKRTVFDPDDVAYLLKVARAAERIYETLRVGNRVSQAQRDALRAALEGDKP